MMRSDTAALPGTVTGGAQAPLAPPGDPLMATYLEGLWAGDLRPRMLRARQVGDRPVRALTDSFPDVIRAAMAEFGDGAFEIVDLRAVPRGPEVDGRPVAKEVSAVVRGTGWQGVWSYVEDPRAAGGASADVLLIEADDADAVYRFADLAEVTPEA